MSDRTRGSGGGPWLPRALRGLGQGTAVLLGLVLLALAGGLVLASQTTTGRRAATGFLESTLREAVQGRVEVGRMTGGNLVTRAVLERVSIADTAGRPFLDLRDVRVEYNPLGFLTGDVHLRRMRAGRLELALLQDRDGSWNFDRIFGGDEEEAAGDTADADGLRLRVTDAVVGGGRIEVRTPWDGPGAPGPASEGDEAPVWRLEEGPEGIERVIELEGVRGSLPLLRLAEPDRPMRIEASGVRARVLAVSQPLELEALDATATFGDTVRVELPAVRTADSRLSGGGHVVPADPPRYRFELDADPLAFAELRWLPVPVPAAGGGEGRLVLRTAADPEVTAVEVSEGVFRSGSSRAEGRFTLHLEETPRFEDVALRMSPLELGLYRRLTGAAEGPDGTVEGSVAGAGPVDLFRLDASLRLRRPTGGGGGADTVAGAPAADTAAGASGPSRVELDGGVGLTGEPRALRDLAVELEAFEPRWTRLLGIDTRQGGRVDGRLELDRTPGGRVAFTADLGHRAAGSEGSQVAGEGSFAPGDTARVDLRLRASPLSLSVLDPWFPALDMVGTVEGDGTLAGTLSSLDASADLRTPRGRLQFDGSFDLAARRRTYDARLTAREIQLRQWIRGGPRTRLDVTGRVRGRGTDPDSLEATFDLEVLPSRFHGARLDSSLLRFSVRGGRASVDTFAVRSDVGTLRGRGGFGLTEDEGGSLFLDLEVPDLSTWNRWTVPGRRAAGDTTARDLFAAFPEDEADGDPDGEEDGEAVPDTLAGSLSVRGVVDGNLASFGFGGSVSGRATRWGEAAADSLRVTVSTADVRSMDSLVVEGRGHGIGWGAHRADSASFRLVRTGEDRGRLRLDARREGRGRLGARAEVLWTPDRREARLEELVLETAPQTLELAGPATVTHDSSGLSVRDLDLSGRAGGRLRADGTVPTTGRSSLDLAARELDLGGLVGLVRPGLPVRGTLTATARVRGTADEPTLEAELQATEPGWRGLGYDSLTATLDYRDRRAEGRMALLHGGRALVRAEGTVRADLALREVEDRLPEDPMELTVTADSLPLALLLLPGESLQEVEGEAVGRVEVRGSPGSPRLSGRMEVRDGAARVVPLGVVLRDVAGRIGFEGSELRLDSLGMASNRGGRATVSGTVGLAELTDPSLDLELRADRLRALDRRRVSLAVDGRGRLTGRYRAAELTGSFRLSNGTIRVREFMQQGEAVDLTDPELQALVDTTGLAERRILARVRDPFLQNLRTDVAVTLGPDLWLRSPELDVEVAGELDVRMGRARDDVTVFGEARLVRGTYRFSGARGVISRQLRITSGRIEFVGTPGGNPNLDVTAAHQVRAEGGTIRVEARITGTMLEPTLSLSSVPPLSESDQVCVLLLNSPCGAPGAGDLARSQLLGRVGAELSSVLAAEVGFDYLELRGGGQRGAAEGGDGAAGDEGSFFSQTEVEAGWYLSPEVFLTVTYPVGNRFPAGSLDWRFSEGWSVELLSELRYGRGLGGGAASNLERERTWGLFLFREWSF